MFCSFLPAYSQFVFSDSDIIGRLRHITHHHRSIAGGKWRIFGVIKLPFFLLFACRDQLMCNTIRDLIFVIWNSMHCWQQSSTSLFTIQLMTMDENKNRAPEGRNVHMFVYVLLHACAIFIWTQHDIFLLRNEINKVYKQHKLNIPDNFFYHWISQFSVL